MSEKINKFASASLGDAAKNVQCREYIKELPWYAIGI
jgi:hypothetical protein